MSAAAPTLHGVRPAFAGAVVDRAVRFVLAWLLARALGPESYGTLAIALAALGLASALAPLGTDVAVVYLCAQAGEDRAAWHGVVRTSVQIATAGGLAVAAGLAAWGVIVGGELGRCLLVAGAAALPWSWLLLGVGVLRARGALAAQAVSFQVVLPVVSLGLSATAAGLGLLTPSAMMAATGAAGVVAAGVAALQVSQLEGIGVVVRPTPWRTVLAVSLPQAVETTLFRLLGWTDVLLLGLLASRAEVGQYKVAFSLAAACQLPMGALTTALNPGLARLLAHGEPAEVQALVWAALRGMALGVAPVGLGLVLFAAPLLGLFGESYRAGVVPLCVLVAAQLASALAIPVLRLLPMSGRFGLNVAEHAVAVALNATAMVLLVPRYGALGAAAALLVTWSTWAVVGVVQARLLFGVRVRA